MEKLKIRNEWMEKEAGQEMDVIFHDAVKFMKEQDGYLGLKDYLSNSALEIDQACQRIIQGEDYQEPKEGELQNLTFFGMHIARRVFLDAIEETLEEERNERADSKRK